MALRISSACLLGSTEGDGALPLGGETGPAGTDSCGVPFSGRACGAAERSTPGGGLAVLRSLPPAPAYLG